MAEEMIANLGSGVDHRVTRSSISMVDNIFHVTSAVALICPVGLFDRDKHHRCAHRGPNRMGHAQDGNDDGWPE